MRLVIIDMKINLSTIVCQSQQQVSTEVDGEIVMMSVEQGKYYGLDNTGSRVWHLIKNPVSVSELVTILLDEYEDSGNTCERDVLTFLQDLQKQELINVSNHQV